MAGVAQWADHMVWKREARGMIPSTGNIFLCNFIIFLRGFQSCNLLINCEK